MQSKAMLNFASTSILLFSLLIIALLQICCCQKTFPNVSCIARERRALLQLRSSLLDRASRLSSWMGEDCCNWEGVGCSKRTGHVVKLDLHNPILQDGSRYFVERNYFINYSRNRLAGEINPSLLSLVHLRYLDLSQNNFSGIQIPKFFGLFKNLRYLNLSNANFEGKIPHHLGNLSRLEHLDLSCTYGYSGLTTSKSVSWITRLSALESLDLSNVDMNGTHDWLQTINMLHSLKSLVLSGCQLPLPNLPHVNFTSLTLLDLSQNYFNSTFPLWLFNMTSLNHLYLSSNYFHGPIPSTISQLNSLTSFGLGRNGPLRTPLLPNSFGTLSSLDYLYLNFNSLGGSLDSLPLGPLCNLTSLRILDLRGNKFQGAIPREIGCLRQLTKLYLSFNMLNGTISSNLWGIRKLESLDVAYNSLMGEISEVYFSKLQKLQHLDLSSNSLSLNVRSSWIPPFQLQSIVMNSLKIGPQFPSWLQTQKSLNFLSMRNASISDNIPDWFGVVHSRIRYLDLSFNNITGRAPKFIERNSVWSYRNIILSSNKFEAPPNFQLPSDIQMLDISRNAMAGPIPLPEDLRKSVLWNELHLNDNYLNGSIPKSICHAINLRVLDLSNNQLSGRLPLCLGNLQDLLVLNLANNTLYGEIPHSLGYIEFLQVLKLNNNKFHGVLPQSLQYLEYMQFLDLGGNELEGFIPSWIGIHLSEMRILGLQSNNFNGDVSLHLCQLSKLQVLNLAQNNLTGSIPRCFQNFSAMALNYSNLGYFAIYDAKAVGMIKSYVGNLVSFMGGRELEFTTNLKYLTSLDLSQNHMAGGIPEELMDLVGLQSLNLSGNSLSGNISKKIGNIKQLRSLDLSMNELSGSIPPSLANLNFLSHLNLSSNELSGPIPTGNQLQTLNDPSIYIDNSGLCGKPLPNKCSDGKSFPGNSPTFENKDDKVSNLSWFFGGLGPGYGVGFLGIFSILLFNKSWRHAYFQFVENISSNVCVWIALKTSKHQRKLQ